MFVRKLIGVHDLHTVGAERNPYDSTYLTRDYDVRYIVGRNGEAISILEEFNPKTGELIHVFWQVDYDPSQRVAMIYG